MYRIKEKIILIAFTCMSSYLSAQNLHSVKDSHHIYNVNKSHTIYDVKDSVKIFFRQGKIDLDPILNDNQSALNRIAETMRNCYADSIYQLRKILVVGVASPEGTLKFNKWLSRKRADVLFSYLSQYSTLPDSLKTSSFFCPDWKGLIQMVKNDSQLPFREETLSLLNRIAGEAETEKEILKQEKHLELIKNLRRGIPYHYMYKKSKDGKSEPWIFDFPKGEARQIELPENDYGVISMNYDTNGIIWENPNSYLNFTADTRDTKSPDGEQASLTPSWLCGDHINWVSVNASHAAASSENAENGVQVITLYPKSMVCRYTYEVNGIRKLERIADIRASLSGMSGSLLMAADKLPGSLSERLLFGGDVIGNQLRGGFYTFGSTRGIAASNLFKLFIKSRSGKLYVLEQDVTAQIQSVPVVGHVGDVHIVINLDFEIPEEGGGSSSGGAGFDVGVDDWGDVNVDIIC